MANLRQTAIQDLLDIEARSFELRTVIYRSAHLRIDTDEALGYQLQAEWIRKSLDHLDTQLKQLKELT